MNTRNLTISCLLLAAIALSASAVPAWCTNQKNEESLGRQFSREFEKGVKLVDDEETLGRVNRIGQTLADIANTHEVPALYGTSDIYQFSYRFKVVEDSDVNAMSLPGGIIYVNTGLLDLAESDDELAGVLAHEIAHAAHHHLRHLAKKSSAVDRFVALATLAGILGKARTQDMNNLVAGAQMLRTGRVSGYTQLAEKDADRTAVTYLTHSQFRPEGLITFMRKLEARRATNPTAAFGIYQTHPTPDRRIAGMFRAMEELGLESEVRRLQSVARAEAQPLHEGSDLYKVVVCDRVLFEPVSIPGGPTSQCRAERIVEAVNAVLDSGACGRGIVCDIAHGSLAVDGTPLLVVEPEDQSASGKSVDEMLSRARQALDYAVWAEWLRGRCTAEFHPSDDF